MLAISNSNGRVLKMVSTGGKLEYGFHPQFGWISETGAEDRIRRRHAHGLRTSVRDAFRFRFEIQNTGQGWNLAPMAGCQVAKQSDGAWKIQTDMGEFFMAPAVASGALAWDVSETPEDKAPWKKAVIAVLLMLLTFFVMPRGKHEEVVEVLPEPVRVIIPEKQKVVQVPKANTLELMKDVKITADKETRRAVQQNLGFLGLLGKKDLKKALGGLPTQAKEVSAGAGAGGKEGSGGEYLQGLGAGVKRATVGNSGVAGLGGIGTKGAGGGAGGYGNSAVGSGEGRTLSKIALSQDMVLEGGLDRSVIQATIAKYLSQIRACYEEQLQKSPGIAGQVAMDFVINGSGDVATAQVGRSSLGNAAVESCIASRMKGWKFPKPVGGVNVKVNYPFLLRPMGT